ncbi:hypothetical protein ACFUTX_00030 [Microbacterium sp. NPDC057407]|uniref:hypothetical protein n=1 Tax=Microbacterium sp. NPDC057407 TaxID=3346120 RepID=UPI00366E3003
MTTPSSAARRARGWAIAGGAILLAGIIAIIVVALSSQPATEPDPTGTPQPTGYPSSTPPDPGDAVVDPDAGAKGWRGEPITSDPELYAAAALEAAATFDTTRASRDEWLAYLDSWFTPDTRYTSQGDREAELEAARLELRQGVVLPQAEWDSLAAEDGRMVAEAESIAMGPVTDDASGDMAIGTTDVVLTFTRADGSGVESSYEESVRVSVQVLCGEGSVPTPDSPQQAGDCKVVRFFTEPVEP